MRTRGLKSQMDGKDNELSALKLTLKSFELEMKDMSEKNTALKTANSNLMVKLKTTQLMDQIKLNMIKELEAKVRQGSQLAEDRYEKIRRMLLERVSVKDLLKQKTTELDNEKSAELRIQHKDKEITALQLKLKSLELEINDKDKKITAFKVANPIRYTVERKMIEELEAKVKQCSDLAEDRELRLQCKD